MTTEEPNDKSNTDHSESEYSGIERTLMKMGVIGELMLLFATGSRWWMAPLVLLLALIGLVLVVLQSYQYVAPFIYVAF